KRHRRENNACRSKTQFRCPTRQEERFCRTRTYSKGEGTRTRSGPSRLQDYRQRNPSTGPGNRSRRSEYWKGFEWDVLSNSRNKRRHGLYSAKYLESWDRVRDQDKRSKCFGRGSEGAFLSTTIRRHCCGSWSGDGAPRLP